MKILVTGAAGFIGSAVSKVLLARGDTVLGFDNVNSYYDVKLKETRLSHLTPNKNFSVLRADLADAKAVSGAFESFRPDRVVHLGAQAGVRYSLENPQAYVDSNITGTLNILESSRKWTVEHLVYASSSSVYGGNVNMPFSVNDHVDHPVSLYAASKKSNELMAHCYSHLFGIPTTGLRFFTVYGPWGRPDMALFRFAKNILAGIPIEVYNYGNHRRDFTYIDDIVEGVVRIMDKAPVANPNWDRKNPVSESSFAPYRLYNIGNNTPIWLNDVIEILEQELGKKATKTLLPLQPGDVPETFADIHPLERDFGFRPKTSIAEGVRSFVRWYREYYN